MKKNRLSFFIVLSIGIIAIFVLNSCSKIFKIEHTAPDESNVSTRPPLSVPPNFNLPSPQKNSASTQKQNIKPNNKKNTKLSTPKQNLETTDLTNSDQTIIKKLSNSNPDKNKLTTSEKQNNKNSTNTAQDYMDNSLKNNKINE